MSGEINIKAVHLFSFGLCFLWSPCAVVEEALLGLLTAFCSRCNACVHERDAVDSVSEERPRELTKYPRILKILQLMGLIWCVMSPDMCVCVCVWAYARVWHFAYFLLFKEPHESFPTLSKIVCFFHHKHNQKYVGAVATIMGFFTDPGPDFTLCVQWIWTVEVCTHYCQLAVSSMHQIGVEKGLGYIKHAFVLQPNLSKWKGSGLQCGRSSRKIMVAECNGVKAIMWGGGGEKKSQSVHWSSGGAFSKSTCRSLLH